ncbi:MAG: hypothetical protein K0R94_1379 [Burkholderiales bacterium]|jgi:hypothetical protein|nr:hypothetical protein [Burkholderiales bacterium]
MRKYNIVLALSVLFCASTAFADCPKTVTLDSQGYYVGEDAVTGTSWRSSEIGDSTVLPITGLWSAFHFHNKGMEGLSCYYNTKGGKVIELDAPNLKVNTKYNLVANWTPDNVYIDSCSQPSIESCSFTIGNITNNS